MTKNHYWAIKRKKKALISYNQQKGFYPELLNQKKKRSQSNIYK